MGTAGGADAFRVFLSRLHLPRLERGRTHRHRSHCVPPTAHRRAGGIATLAVKGGGGPLALRRRGPTTTTLRVTGLQEKPAAGARPNPTLWQLRRLRVSSRRVLRLHPPRALRRLANDVFPALLRDGHPVPRCGSSRPTGTTSATSSSTASATSTRCTDGSTSWCRAGRSRRACGSARAPRSRAACASSRRCCWAPAAWSSPAPSSSGRSSSATGASSSAAPCSRASSTGTAPRRAATPDLAGSILGRNVVVHHEAVVREDSVVGATARRSGAHALVDAGARLEPRTCLSAGAHCARGRRDVTAGPRVQPEGALDGLLDLVFPRRCVVCAARPAAWLCASCAGGAASAPRRPLPAVRRAAATGREARPSGAPGSVRPAHARLPRVRRSRARLLERLGRVLLRAGRPARS